MNGSKTWNCRRTRPFRDQSFADVGAPTYMDTIMRGEMKKKKILHGAMHRMRDTIDIRLIIFPCLQPQSVFLPQNYVDSLKFILFLRSLGRATNGSRSSLHHGGRIPPYDASSTDHTPTPYAHSAWSKGSYPTSTCRQRLQKERTATAHN